MSRFDTSDFKNLYKTHEKKCDDAQIKQVALIGQTVSNIFALHGMGEIMAYTYLNLDGSTLLLYMFVDKTPIYLNNDPNQAVMTYQLNYHYLATFGFPRTAIIKNTAKEGIRHVHEIEKILEKANRFLDQQKD